MPHSLTALAMALGAMLMAPSFAGCGPATTTTAAPVRRAEPLGAACLDRIVRPGEQVVFGGSGMVLAIGRETAGAIRLDIHPLLWPTPHLRLLGDPPGQSPIEFESLPRWSELTYTTIGRPYRIRLDYTRRRPGQGPPATQPDEYGSVTYFMRAGTNRGLFSENLVPYTSALQLVLIALGPLPAGGPAPGRTRILAVHKDGKDYWATIDASPAGRRVLRFPNALLWADWSDKNLAEQCVFDVESVADWPRTTIRAVNFTPLGPVTMTYVRTEACPP